MVNKGRKSAPPAVPAPVRQLRAQQQQPNERRLAPAILVELPAERGAVQEQRQHRAAPGGDQNVQQQVPMPAANAAAPNEGQQNQREENPAQVQEIVQAVIAGLVPLLPQPYQGRAGPAVAVEPPPRQEIIPAPAQPPARVQPPAPRVVQPPAPRAVQPPPAPEAPEAPEEPQNNEDRNRDNQGRNEELLRLRRLLRNSQDANRNLQQRVNEQEYYIRQLERRYDDLVQENNNHQGRGERQGQGNQRYRQGQGQGNPRYRQGQGHRPY